jgi:lipopolysaccharide/colanic/teichoic acid biosynthesis glycosyltransferase
MDIKNISTPEELYLRKIPLWKTLMDKTGSILGLLIFSPVFIIVAILVKASSRGPVFFRQLRTGWGGKPFYAYKFRTMIQGAEYMRDDLLAFNERGGPVFKMTDDPRITRIGRFLRKSSIDELPQLINVLKGEMSLVGPRPLYIVEENAMTQWQRIRRTVKPGITCLWQVYKRDGSDFDDWVRYDIQYIRNLSFWLDLKILLITIPAVLSQKGAK